MMTTHSFAIRLIAVLWVIWGLVHVFAGVVIVSQDTAAAVAAVADAVNPALLTGPYHDAAGALINQHGFNLLWIGLTTMISAIYIWRGVMMAMFIAGLVGGLADVGYFLFMDLGGFVNFIPGTVMTLVSAAAILLSVWVWRSKQK